MWKREGLGFFPFWSCCFPGWPDQKNLTKRANRHSFEWVSRKKSKKNKTENGILLSKLFWPTVRKNALVIEKNFWNSRLKSENSQNLLDHLNNLFKQWKVRTIPGNRMLFNLFPEVSKISKNRTILTQIGTHYWDLEICRKS